MKMLLNLSFRFKSFPTLKKVLKNYKGAFLWWLLELKFPKDGNHLPELNQIESKRPW